MTTELVDLQEAAAQAAASGLVSISTSDTQELEKAFWRREERKNLRERVQAFDIDPVVFRLRRLRKNVGASARLMSAHRKRGERKGKVAMVTLTYAGTNADWQARHITGFIKCLRQWCTRRGVCCRYVWVAELQKRGVIHYHIAVWLPRHLSMPKPDKQGWWPHGMSNVIAARKPVAYLMKYLSKDTSKTFGCYPKGARIYGVGGLAELSCVRRWLNYPRFIQCRSDVNERWSRVAGGGWADSAGEWFPSEFQYCYVSGKASVQRVRKHERLIEPSGAFSWIH